MIKYITLALLLTMCTLGYASDYHQDDSTHKITYTIIDTSGNTTGNYFTFYIIDFTQEEIDAFDQAILDTDIHSDLESKHIILGEILFRRIKSTVRRARENGEITTPQTLVFKRNLVPLIRPLKDGDWDLVKENLETITTPPNADVHAVLSGITGTVITYINTEYTD